MAHDASPLINTGRLFSVMVILLSVTAAAIAWLSPFTAMGSVSVSDLPFPSGSVEQVIEEARNSEIKSTSCAAVPAQLRAAVFEHFTLIRDYQRQNGGRFDARDARIFARGLGRTLSESSGDPTCMTQMNGRQVGTFKAATDLKEWRGLFEDGHAMGVETNFGLLQISANRLYIRFPSHILNDTISALTEPAYQLIDTVEQTRSIFKGYVDIAREEWKTHGSLSKTLRYCGTPFLFSEGKQGEKGRVRLESALRGILDDVPFKRVTDPVTHEKTLKWSWKHKDVAAFGKWLTLCPALGFDLGLLQPPQYFSKSTRNHTVCEAHFKKILKEPPPVLVSPKNTLANAPIDPVPQVVSAPAPPPVLKMTPPLPPVSVAPAPAPPAPPPPPPQKKSRFNRFIDFWRNLSWR